MLVRLDKCNHIFNMRIKTITYDNKPGWCQYCNSYLLCEDKDCKMCFNNSFASIERSKFLNDKSINPRMLFKSTNKKFKFDCDTCEKVFETQLEKDLI